jgi:hypothetical protein
LFGATENVVDVAKFVVTAAVRTVPLDGVVSAGLMVVKGIPFIHVPVAAL